MKTNLTRVADEDPELRALLARCSVPAPPPGLFERALRHAARQEQQRPAARSRLFSGFGALIAASVVILVVGSLATDFLRPGAGELPMVSMDLYQPETVRLVFAADSALAGATMTVRLPDGIELQGFPGEREIRWETSLSEGRNLLPLTLVATTPAGGPLEARLEHDSRDRTFRLWIEVG